MSTTYYEVVSVQIRGYLTVYQGQTVSGDVHVTESY